MMKVRWPICGVVGALHFIARRFRLCAVFAFVTLLPMSAMTFAGVEPPMLLQQPSLSHDEIVFVYGDDLWVVPREGGDARRLTSSVGSKSRPRFSPDGRQIAFTWDSEGSQNVYLVDSRGGMPRRLTYFPGHDLVTGWTPDGSRIVFESTRESHSPRFYQLFTVSVDGGPATAVPLPMGYEGSFSPDGRRIAYTPIPRGIVFGGGPLLGWQHARWRHYGGGLKPRIWLADVADSRVEIVPRSESSDFSPMWVADSVYFLSDRAGRVAIFRYDTTTRTTRQMIPTPQVDVESASAGPGGIVYETPGFIRLLDLQSGQDRVVPIRLRGDFPQLAPRIVSVAKLIASAAISPSGSEAVVGARGDVLRVSLTSGRMRNLTQSSGVADRDPVWSPDGRSIAYFSDESGEFALHIRDTTRSGAVSKFALVDRSSHFFRPVWSPSGTRLLFMQGRNLWYVDLATGVPVKVTTDPFHTPITEIDQRLSADWAVDGQWIAYNRMLKSGLRAVFLYSLASGQSHQVTDGGADAESVSFDPDGEHLYFLASTNVSAKIGWLEMNALRAVSAYHVYAVALRDSATEASRVLSESVDLAGIRDRVAPLPIPARNYLRLSAPWSGELILLTAPDAGSTDRMLYHFDSRSLKVTLQATDILSFSAARERRRVLVEGRDGLRWIDINPRGSARLHSLRSDTWTVAIDPRAEWRQIYREAWQAQRDAFYAENLHGVDLDTMNRRYLPLLESVASRADLNYLLTLMLGEFAVGHLFVGAGDMPSAPVLKAGLLGADFEVQHGRQRFRRILTAGQWNPQLRAPLTEPGRTVSAGEYLLAIDGVSVTDRDDIHRRLLGKVNVPVRLTVGTEPDGQGSREVSVTPIADELPLRSVAWIRDNAQRIAERTDGRIGYVYLPDTGLAGMRSFEREFHASAHLDGLVVDARFNSGGTMADYILEKLQATDLARFYARDAEPMPAPRSIINGPKVLLTNEYSASGGDYLPWAFRKTKLGTIIGQRTWGGLVGIVDQRVFTDGGFVTVPEDGFYSLDGNWEVENAGVSPDVHVALDPYEWRRGRDVQLESAIDSALRARDSVPRRVVPTPVLPRYRPW